MHVMGLDIVCLKRAFAVLFGAGLALQAMPPATPAEMAAYRKDGSFEARVAQARTLANHRTADRLVERAQRRLVELNGRGRLESAPPAAWKGLPTKGTVKLFVLAIDFSDAPAGDANPVSALQGRIFGEGTPAEAPYESLRAFYRRSSYNQLDLTGTVLGWYRPSYPRSAVPQTEAGREGLIKEAIQAFQAQGHDFTQYDNDGDGTLDAFAVLWTGADQGWGSFWWAYKTDWTDSTFRVDGKQLQAYTWQWVARGESPTFSPRILIHETGHLLGLPDYYDYADSLGPKGGLGGLDMMDASWGDHNAFSKFLLDWITPAVATQAAAGQTLRASGQHGDALLVFPEAPEAGAFGEYFLVQNRFRTGNDRDLPADGLLVWHVDARLNASGQDFRYDNSYAEHKLLRLVEADGLGEIEQGFGANAGDYWAEGQTFGPATQPASNRYDGTSTYMGLRDLSAPGATMTLSVFTQAPDLSAPEGLPGTPVPPGPEVNQNLLSFMWDLGTLVEPEGTLIGWQIQLGSTPGASDLYDGLVQGTSFSLAGVAREGVPAFARVRARNAAGLWSAWSASSEGLTYRIPVLGSAVLDGPGLTFRTFGDGFWTASSTFAAVGATCAESPTLARGQASHLETTVVGPATLTFRTRTSCDPWDGLTVSMDGLPYQTLGGETPWTTHTLSIPAGTHTLRWSFHKATGFSSGADKVWVDGITTGSGSSRKRWETTER